MLITEQICNQLSDRELIEKSLEQVDFFSCLYDRYEARLLRYIKRLARLSDEEAEDILQDAFIKIWRNLNAFDPRMSFNSWAYRIVHNEAISAWRRRVSFGKDQQVPWEEAGQRELGGAGISLEEDALATEANERLLRELVHQLPPHYESALLLKYWEDLSYEEISDVLKIPEGTVATRINRGKQALRKLAEAKGLKLQW
jgi:RNA polymerase sigma-70 factor (ECF subfamily)